MYAKSIFILSLMMAISPAAVVAGDAKAGKTKSSACVACHGATGISNLPMYPNLAGQKAPYLVKALKAYQSGERSDPTMKAMAGPLSAADIENLAAFYSSLTCN